MRLFSTAMRISPVRSPLAQRGYGLWHSLQFVVGDLEVVDEGVARAVLLLFNIGARLVREYFGPENHPFTVIANSICWRSDWEIDTEDKTRTLYAVAVHTNRKLHSMHFRSPWTSTSTIAILNSLTDVFTISWQYRRSTIAKSPSSKTVYAGHR